MNALAPTFAGVSLALGAVVAWNGRGHRSLPGCGSGSSCDELGRGRWSRLGALRVATLGVGVYLCMFVSALLVSRAAVPTGVVAGLLVASSVAAIGAAVWFTWVQGAVVRRWCPWCLATHATALTAGVAALWDAGRGGGLPITIGVAAVVALAVGQLFIQPKLYAVVEAPPQPDRRPAAVEVDRPAVAPVVPPRLEHFVRGRVALDVNGWPVLGRPDAPHLLVDLFDYTCHHCRALHGHLSRVREKYPDDVAVIMVPVPQDVRCNRFLTVQDPHHVNACEYARYALAVWMADAATFAEYDRWLFAPATVPTLAEARAKAEALVGPARLAEQLAGERVSRGVRDGVDAHMAAGGGPMPQLLLRTAALVGQVPSFETVCGILEKQLGLGNHVPLQTLPPPQPDVYVVNVDPRQFGGGF